MDKLFEGTATDCEIGFPPNLSVCMWWEVDKCLGSIAFAATVTGWKHYHESDRQDMAYLKFKSRSQNVISVD